MTRFRVWAPEAARVEVDADAARTDMARAPGGWWEADVGAGHGSDYAFALDGGTALPDPRSAWQPAGVHGPSRVLDHDRFTWSDQAWTGRPLAGGVVYELHVGTFTPEGTFDAAAARLDHLADLGVDFVELLPVNAFPGRHGWGYDGVGLFAVHEPYGGPDGLKRFVDACHGHGLGVIMDVVYNHLGPDGNYLPRFGPYLTDTHQTPWGAAVNLDAPGSDEVRRFVVDNARMWLRDYHCDGLRLDAVHALVDGRALHILEELAAAVAALAAQLRRPLTVIAESDRNDPRTVRSRDAGGYGLDAQWSDDFHHALHALLTGERFGYYCDFGSPATLAKALTRVFVHDGTWSTFRGRHHGRPAGDLPGHRFVACLQDHDQVGNRAKGERLAQLVTPGLAMVGAALVLTSPFTPMLFMGEEWGARTPWQFFSDHDAELGALVSQGRRREFEGHGWGPDEVPDPQDPATFERSKLDWSERDKDEHAAMLDFHRRLIALRRSQPDLSDGRTDAVRVTWDEQARWLLVRRGRVAIACNLGPAARSLPLPAAPSSLLLASDPGCTLGDRDVQVAAESVAILALS